MTHGGDVWQGGAPEDWLDFSANVRPEGAPDWVRRALMEGLDEARYYPDVQMRRARAAMAQYLGAPERFVCPTAGGIGAIDLAARMQSAGNVIFTPCFSEYQARAQGRAPIRKASLLCGRHMVGEPAEQANGALFEGCAVWLSNPLNPVGTAFTRAQILSLLERVEKMRGWLIVDEAFIAYCPGYTALPLVEAHERLIVVGSMTKILGIPGVRLGYICAQPQTLNKLTERQLPWELNCFANAVACALPANAARIERDARQAARRRTSLCAMLSQLGLFVYPGQAPFILADLGRAAAPVARRLRERKILVRECMDFEGVDDGCHLRLAVKDTDSNLRFIQCLREALTCAENV